MGGKGRKRREKNYRAAHGGQSRLPPPPSRSSLDAVPSKLRRLISSTASSQPGSVKVSVDSAQSKRADGGGNNLVDKVLRPEDKSDSVTTEVEKEGSDEQHSTHEIRKKKRKRKQVDDLRFETAELGAVGSQRKERKKKLLEARKKKHKKVKADESMGFPGQEVIRFGEVVQAPPKLVTVPKSFKPAHDASQERIRLKAVEAYRNRRKWMSRPGINLSLPVITSPSL